LVTKLPQRLALLRHIGLGRAHPRLAIATTKVGANAHRPLENRAFRCLSGGGASYLPWLAKAIVGGSALTPVAALFEVLQWLKTNHSPNIFASPAAYVVFCSSHLLSALMIRQLKLQESKTKSQCEPEANISTTGR
jgi:hypothetical protein